MRAKVEYWLAQATRPLEFVAADYQDQRFRPHWHAGFTVGIVTRNAQGFRCDGHDWIAGAGDLILINPLQVHDGYSLDGRGWSTRMVYIPSASLQGLLRAAGEADLPGRFTRPVLHLPRLAEMFLAWHRLSEDGGDLLAHPLTRSMIAELRSLMPADGPSPTLNGFNGTTTVSLERMRAMAVAQPLAAGGLRAELACSRTTSYRRLKAQTGLAPKPFLSQLRLTAAKDMLAIGAPIADAVFECGYHDQSHLSRDFTAAYGFTPGQFRRVHLGL